MAPIVSIEAIVAVDQAFGLAKNGQIKFDLPQSVIDTIEYCKWSDTTISIGALLNTHDGSTTPSFTQDEQDVRNAQAKMHATCSVLHLNDPGMM